MRNRWGPPRGVPRIFGGYTTKIRGTPTRSEGRHPVRGSSHGPRLVARSEARRTVRGLSRRGLSRRLVARQLQRPPEVPAGHAAIGLPALAEGQQLLRRGHLTAPIGEAETLANAEVARGQHVGTAQGED